MKNVAVFGIGYVGCVTAACLSRDGHRVIGVDVDPQKVSELNAGIAPIAEPGLSEIVAEQVRAGNLRATRDAEEAVRNSEVALIAVGTPSADDGSVSIDGLEGVVGAIGRALRGPDSGRVSYTVVVRSTLLPGLLEQRLGPLLEASSGRVLGREVRLANNPEFLREGTAIADYDHPPFVLIGANEDETARAVAGLYRRVHAEAIVTDTRTAALVKYACNSFHALKVAFANEVGVLARSFGADGGEVMELLCRDRRLNIAPAYLRPGFAFGGSCLPKDVRALARHAEKAALHLDLIASILPSNDQHLRRALGLIQSSGHRKVGIVGLSFKAGTDDLRESPMVLLVEALLGRGYDLKIYDPGVAVSRLRGRNLAYVDRHLPHLAALLVDDPAELYRHAGLLVLGTDVAEELDWRRHHAGAVVDLRRDLAVARRVPAGAGGVAGPAPTSWPQPAALL